MVSKVAVIAIVAIIAVPILMGYAFNMTEETETGYRQTGDPVNVTPLLQNDTKYTYAHGEIHSMNTKFSGILPKYESIGTTKTSLPSEQMEIYWSGLGTQNLSDLVYYYIAPHYDHTLHSIDVDITNNGVSVATITNFNTLYYDAKAGTIDVSYYRNGTFSSVVVPGGNFDAVTFTNSNPSLQPYTLVNLARGNTYSYVDFSAGFHFDTKPNRWYVDLPNNSRSILMTIDLDSITDANYLMKFTDTFGSAKALKKTTTDGNVTWQLTDGFGLYVYSDIYYDSSRSQNVIQMYIEVELLRLTSADWATFNHRIVIDYVGDWPDLIGKANSYWTYEFQEETQQSPSADLSQIRFGNTIASEPGSLNRSPTMRIDDAYYRAFEYPIIGDRVYDPAAIKTNPATTINNPTQYGTSIVFGGNTYNVSKDGKINLNGHNIQVKDIVFLSIPNPEGGYDNMMGNTLISNTAQPSTITFNGKWSASITTTEQESYTYTVTEWKAGDFAWDGMDHNFILAGLLASLGAFVGVGIYARRTKSTVWPLLIVCGGAALVFFLML